MIKKLKKNEKGFTLVELVVVIAILAILALLLVPRIMGSVEDASKSRAESDARTIASEIATFNALAKVKGTHTLPDPLVAAYSVLATDMVTIGRVATDMDSFTIDGLSITIVIDVDGNPTVVLPTGW